MIKLNDAIMAREKWTVVQYLFNEFPREISADDIFISRCGVD